MMTNKALAQLRGDLTKAKNHLAFLERMAALPVTEQPLGILRATPEMVATTREEVADLERWLAEATPQLALFNLPTP